MCVCAEREKEDDSPKKSTQLIGWAELKDVCESTRCVCKANFLISTSVMKL